MCCAVLSPLQVDLPPGVGPRRDHTATVISSSGNRVVVLVHGGRKTHAGKAISDSAVIHLGRLL